MKECFPSRDTTQLESHIFRMYDSNGDGYVDFREFMIVLHVMSNGTLEENLKQIFQVFDINNDGTVSQKKLVKEAFKEMDINTDGKITKEEFIHACLSRETLSTMLALKELMFSYDINIKKFLYTI